MNTRGRKAQWKDAEGGDDEDGDMIDDMDKNMKHDKFTNFKSETLHMSKFLMGEYIRTGEKERENINKMSENIIALADNESAGGTNGIQRHIRGILMGGGTNSSLSNNYEGPDDMSMHINCKLCQYVSIRKENSENNDFLTAYDAIVQLDFENTGTPATCGCFTR